MGVTTDFSTNAFGNLAVNDFSRPSLLRMMSETFSGKAELDEPEYEDFEVVSTEAQKAESTVSEFCLVYPASRVEPTQAELDVFLSQCSSLEVDDVSESLYRQLTWRTGNLDWQPRFRALCVIEHFYFDDSCGKEIARSVASEAEPHLNFLASAVPQCMDKATRLLELLQSDADALGWAQPCPRNKFEAESTSAQISTEPHLGAVPSKGAFTSSDVEARELLSQDIDGFDASEVESGDLELEEALTSIPAMHVSHMGPLLIRLDDVAELATIQTDVLADTTCETLASQSGPSKVPCDKQLRFLSLAAVNDTETTMLPDPFARIVDARIEGMTRKTFSI